jgi:hypothetical protein
MVTAGKSGMPVSTVHNFVLVVASLLASLRPTGPYPLSAISGEQGSAKTSLSKRLRVLVDPNVASVRALPREERELMIAANNGDVLACNLSGFAALALRTRAILGIDIAFGREAAPGSGYEGPRDIPSTAFAAMSNRVYFAKMRTENGTPAGRRSFPRRFDAYLTKGSCVAGKLQRMLNCCENVIE